jgi:hypothetical protein
MSIADVLSQANGRVRIRLTDGSVHTGSFRTDILSGTALAAYFFGDAHDLSLPVAAIAAIERVDAASAAHVPT